MTKKITLFFALIGMSLFAGAQTLYDITFQVDMNQYTGTFTTPEVNGNFNGWCGNCAAMTDANNDGIWEKTIQLAAGSYEFKFSHDNWAGQESLTPGDPCTMTTSGFTNRTLTVTGSDSLAVVCWESCQACGAAPSTSNVTFQVDMSEYTGSYTEVNLNGTFNGWCGSCAVMTDADNDSIFEITVNVPNDTIEYKFTVDGWTDDETLTPGMPCTVTDGAFTNRFYVPMGDTTLPAVCWESCEACDAMSIDENQWAEALAISPNPNNGWFTITGTLSETTDMEVSVTDLQGRVIFQTAIFGSQLNEKIDVSHAASGIYLISVRTKKGTTVEKLVLSK